MKYRLFSLLTLLLSYLHAFAEETKPLSVLVIGGGPTGLATAIEAHLAGADVTIVEKRDAYTRQNTLFLYTATLELFDKWGVAVPAMQELYFREQRRGFALIKDLENSLATRVHELGISRIQGEFTDFVENELAAVIQTSKGEIRIPYDILVGADGTHSKVRDTLNIPCSYFGEAIAGVAMIPATNAEKKIGVEIGKYEAVFAKRVTTPYATVLLMQNRPGVAIEEITKNELAKFAFENGWQEDAWKIETAGILYIENIAISLQRALAFCHPSKKVILVGDTAGSASFYQGMGANYSFKTAEFAGDFFKQWKSTPDAYDSFNQKMETATQKLIEDSQPLFQK